jgi:N-acetylmuramoyl-L-alanine amidase
MIIREDYIPLGHPNRPGDKIPFVKGIIVHYTANFSKSAGDEMHQKYVGRDYDAGVYWDGNEKKLGRIEKGSMGKGPRGLGVKFRCAGAHVFVDADSATFIIPPDEVTWHAGDRNLPWDKKNRGQTPLARILFGNRQNYSTLGVEICCNTDWEKACANAQEVIAQLLRANHLSTKQVMRHFDVTGKMCPKPFVDDPKAWAQFVAGIEVK